MPSIERLRTATGITQFLIDIALSAGAAFTLSALVWWLVEVFALPGFFIFGVMPTGRILAAIYTLFAIMALCGLLRLRVGWVAGPAIVAAFIHWQIGAATDLEETQADAEQVQVTALATAAQEPPRRQHEVIALDGGSKSSCERACINVIALTGRTIARSQRFSTRPLWRLYRPAAGAVCGETQNAVLTMRFLAAGHIGPCAVQEEVAELPNALILRSRGVDAYHPASDMPPGYHGTVIELFEREHGVDRLLARRVVGNLPQSPPARRISGKQRARIDAGPPIDEGPLLAEVAQRPVDTIHRAVDPFPLDKVLDGLEAFVGRKEIVGTGATRSIEEFAASIANGVIANEGRKRPGELRPRVARLLASDDPLRIRIGLNALSLLPLGQRGFADERLLELTFGPDRAIKPENFSRLWSWRLKADADPISDSVREKARIRLDDPALTAEQRGLLAEIAGR